MAVRVELLVSVTEVAAVAPKWTVEPAVNPVPEIVTLEPPAKGPSLGEIDDTVGIGS
jgi:hypothetical protein